MFKKNKYKDANEISQEDMIDTNILKDGMPLKTNLYHEHLEALAFFCRGLDYVYYAKVLGKCDPYNLETIKRRLLNRAREKFQEAANHLENLQIDKELHGMALNWLGHVNSDAGGSDHNFKKAFEIFPNYKFAYNLGVISVNRFVDITYSVPYVTLPHLDKNVGTHFKEHVRRHNINKGSHSAFDSEAKFAIKNYFSKSEDAIRKDETDLHPGHKRLNLRGRYLFWLQKYTDSFWILSSTLDTSSNLSHDLMWMGRCVLELKNNSDAITTFTNSIELNPNNIASYYWRGRALYELGKYDLALKDFEKIVQICPNPPYPTIAFIKICLFKLNRFQESYDCTQEVTIEYDDDDLEDPYHPVYKELEFVFGKEIQEYYIPFDCVNDEDFPDWCPNEKFERLESSSEYMIFYKTQGFKLPSNILDINKITEFEELLEAFSEAHWPSWELKNIDKYCYFIDGQNLINLNRFKEAEERLSRFIALKELPQYNFPDLLLEEGKHYLDAAKAQL